MKVIADLKKIACLNSQINRLAEKVAGNPMMDVGMEVGSEIFVDGAYLVTGVKKKNGHLYRGKARLDNYGLVDDLYYCSQYQGCCEDSYYGTLYFATNVPGQYVAVPFND